MKFTPPIPSCSNENFCFHVGDYSFGFNGKDKESEFNSGAYDFGARIHDARLGRWMSVDPKSELFHNLTTFQFADNSPIVFLDLGGEVIEIFYKNEKGETKSVIYTPGMSVTHDNDFVSQTIKALNSYHSSSSVHAQAIVEACHSSERTVEVHQVKWNIQSACKESPNSPEEGNSKVNYDPTEGLAVDNKTVYPPGMILLIEMEHAKEELKYLEKIDLVKAELAKKGITDFKEISKDSEYIAAVDEYDKFLIEGDKEEERNFDVEKELSKELGYGPGPEGSYFSKGSVGEPYTTDDVLSGKKMEPRDAAKQREKSFDNTRKHGQGK